MTMLSVAPRSRADAELASAIDEMRRRASATPPGTCPLTMQLALLQTSALQTCGKCVPCRDGLPQLANMLTDIVNCTAEADIIDDFRQLALMVRDSSDCAIGWHAAEMLLEGLDTFADEYANHLATRRCIEGIGQTVPCETDCPAHVDIPGYIAFTAEGDFESAVKLIRKDNPYPTACALICEHPCEQRCRRAIIDAPVNIRGIKKFAVDSLAANEVPTPAPLPDSGHKVAVIGGGPSGMTCAYYLSLMGHRVTVFEMREKLGGMMRYGIPAYRFPRERLDEDNEAILSTGNIDVRYGCRVGAGEMREIADTFDAVYVAIGAHAGKTLSLEGVEADGVMSAVEMLGAIGEGDYPDFTGKSVVVIGGGNVAMDCARTSVRSGAADVTVVYRRRLEDMTALPAEVESAMQEGIEMMCLLAPARIESDASGHVARLVCQPQRIGAVRGGRPAPVAADKPEVALDADIVLIAVGQDIVSEPFEEFGMAAERNRFKADENLRADGYDNIFVGGDCQTGPKSAIRAIGAAREALTETPVSDSDR